MPEGKFQICGSSVEGPLHYPHRARRLVQEKVSQEDVTPSYVFLQKARIFESLTFCLNGPFGQGDPSEKRNRQFVLIFIPLRCCEF
jgi:hypothetical protein